MSATFHILLALDPGAPSADAFVAIEVLLRGQPDTEVHGVFVEDDNLVRYSSLPFAQELVFTSGTIEQISVTQVERQLRARGERVRATFEVGVRALQVAHKFTIARGDVLSELRHSATQADLLIVARCRRDLTHRTWLGTTVTSLIDNPPASLLFVQEPWATGASVLVISIDDAHPEAHVTRLGELFARVQGLPLHELDFVSGTGTAGMFAGEPSLQMDNLLRACRRLNVRLLVLPDTPTVRVQLDLAALIDQLPASVLLVRV